MAGGKVCRPSGSRPDGGWTGTGARRAIGQSPGLGRGAGGALSGEPAAGGCHSVRPGSGVGRAGAIWPDRRACNPDRREGGGRRRHRRSRGRGRGAGAAGAGARQALQAALRNRERQWRLLLDRRRGGELRQTGAAGRMGTRAALAIPPESAVSGERHSRGGAGRLLAVPSTKVTHASSKHIRTAGQGPTDRLGLVTERPRWGASRPAGHSRRFMDRGGVGNSRLRERVPGTSLDSHALDPSPGRYLSRLTARAAPRLSRGRAGSRASSARRGPRGHPVAAAVLLSSALTPRPSPRRSSTTPSGPRHPGEIRVSSRTHRPLVEGVTSRQDPFQPRKQPGREHPEDLVAMAEDTGCAHQAR